MLYKFDGKQPTAGKDTYVSDIATVIGDVVIGSSCYIGHGAILRADYGRIEIGDGTAIEEGVVVHAPPGDTNRIGRRVTIGHGAVVHGKHIGHQAVIGMGAILSIWSEIGEGAIVDVIRLADQVSDVPTLGGHVAEIGAFLGDLNASSRR